MTRPGARAHLWVVDLDAPGAPAGDALRAGVSPDELERARSMASEESGRRWLRSRYATRAVVSAALGVGALDVDFDRAASGKPLVRGGGAGVNVAHSGAVALVAVVGVGAVGVDVERVRARRREATILARVVGEAARRRWASAPEAGRTAVFFDEWVRFEAAVKCRGATLAGSFGADVADGLTVTRVDAGPGYAAAVALDVAGAPAPERFEWPA